MHEDVNDINGIWVPKDHILHHGAAAKSRATLGQATLSSTTTTDTLSTVTVLSLHPKWSKMWPGDHLHPDLRGASGLRLAVLQLPQVLEASASPSHSPRPSSLGPMRLTW